MNWRKREERKKEKQKKGKGGVDEGEGKGVEMGGRESEREEGGWIQSPAT